MTDHKAESERIMTDLNENFIAIEGQTDATMIATAIDALRHATLYAAEQQRIANLIEVGRDRDRDRQLDRELNDPNFQVVDGSTLKVSVSTDVLNASNAVKSLIREGLGL